MASSENTTKLRYALTGVGGTVYNMHKPGLALDTVEVVGVTDLDADAARRTAEEVGCPHFPDYQTILTEAAPDVVVIMVPHPYHAPMSIDAMNAGAHVLVEKPVAVHVGEADEMVRVAAQTGRTLAVNFQQRLRPEIRAAHQLIQAGRLGKIQHVDIKITWTRTAAYYKSAQWRGTWNGEGGGVLMNQAPHEFDLLCYLVGMPARVFAWTRTIAHKIETEDTLQAMVEWADGAMGSLHISTAEAGQPQRFEIIGTGGHLEIGSGALKFQRFESDVLDFIETSDDPFSAPKMHLEPVEIGTGEGNHRAIYQDLHEAITTGRPPIADGASAMMSLELANAMNYSSYTGQAVDFPLDRQKYTNLLDDLRAGRAVPLR